MITYLSKIIHVNKRSPRNLFYSCWTLQWHHIHGLVQDCSISSMFAMVILQSFTKPSAWPLWYLICSDYLVIMWGMGSWRLQRIPGGCFSNVTGALQNNLAKIHNTGNHIYGENFKLKLCTCAQSHALGTRTKFQLEILIRTTISAIHKFQENILESLRNVSETTSWSQLTLKSLRLTAFNATPPLMIKQL